MIGEFHRNAAMPDGRHFYCMACHNRSVAERRSSARARLAEFRDVASFINAMRQEMQSRALAISALAREVGAKPDTIGAWLAGTKQPSQRLQLRVADHLGIPLRLEAFRVDSTGAFPDGVGICASCGVAFPGYRKTFPKHCSRACANKAQSTRQFGSDNPSYKEGRKLTDGGYVQILLGKGHPLAGRGGYALEHRYVMSQHLGRPLRRYEVVHHINGDKQDNRLENLELCAKEDTRHPPGQRVQDMIQAVQDHPNLQALSDKDRELVLVALRTVFACEKPEETK